MTTVVGRFVTSQSTVGTFPVCFSYVIMVCHHMTAVQLL